MNRVTSQRALWLARTVLPAEPALRAWLGRRRVAGLDVDDVVQETYAILCGLDSVEAIRDPRRYAFQTAYSIVLRHLRHAKVVPMHAMDDLESLQIAIGDPSPEQTAIDRDALGALARFVATLPGRVRQVFVMRRIEGLSQRAIAHRLHISEKTVEKHISKALHLLSERFAHGGPWGAEASIEQTPEERPRNDSRRDARPRNRPHD